MSEEKPFFCEHCGRECDSCDAENARWVSDFTGWQCLECYIEDYREKQSVIGFPDGTQFMRDCELVEEWMRLRGTK